MIKTTQTKTDGFAPIVSSNLEGARYDKAKQELYVKFTSGTVYRYKKVTPSLYKQFSDLFDGKKGSAGSFFARNIRGLENEEID